LAARARPARVPAGLSADRGARGCAQDFLERGDLYQALAADTERRFGWHRRCARLRGPAVARGPVRPAVARAQQ